MLGRMIGTLLVVALATTAGAQPLPANVAPGVWRTYADRLPPGALVKVRLQSGERFTAALLGVEEVLLFRWENISLNTPMLRQCLGW